MGHALEIMDSTYHICVKPLGPGHKIFTHGIYLILYILMDFPILIGTLSMGLVILYFKGS